jgi:hypothetical protein
MRAKHGSKHHLPLSRLASTRREALENRVDEATAELAVSSAATQEDTGIEVINQQEGVPSIARRPRRERCGRLVS